MSIINKTTLDNYNKFNYIFEKTRTEKNPVNRGESILQLFELESSLLQNCRGTIQLSGRTTDADDLSKELTAKINILLQGPDSKSRSPIFCDKEAQKVAIPKTKNLEPKNDILSKRQKIADVLNKLDQLLKGFAPKQKLLDCLDMLSRASPECYKALCSLIRIHEGIESTDYVQALLHNNPDALSQITNSLIRNSSDNIVGQLMERQQERIAIAKCESELDELAGLTFPGIAQEIHIARKKEELELLRTRYMQNNLKAYFSLLKNPTMSDEQLLNALHFVDITKGTKENLFRLVGERNGPSTNPIKIGEQLFHKDPRILLSICKQQTSSGTSQPLPAKETAKPNEIAKLFDTQSPNFVLEKLHASGYEYITECHCIPQFSRQINQQEAISNARAITEKALIDMIAKKYPNKKQPIHFCSIAPGGTFEDLIILSKLHALGYNNISWTLVDPCYKNDEYPIGQIILSEFRDLAEQICPGIKIRTLDTLQDIQKTGLVADIFFNFDDGHFSMPLPKYQEVIQPFEKYIHSLDKPVIYLHSDKDNSLSPDQLTLKIHATVDLDYISPNPSRSKEKRIFDDTLTHHSQYKINII